MSEPGAGEPDRTGPGPYQPQPMRPEDERTWGVLAHVAAFAAFIGLPLIGPLIVFLVFGPRSRYVRHHSAEALNFNITTVLAAIASVILIFLIVGLLLIFAVLILWIVLTVVAASAASRGEWYRYPLSIRFVR